MKSLGPSSRLGDHSPSVRRSDTSSKVEAGVVLSMIGDF